MERKALASARDDLRERTKTMRKNHVEARTRGEQKRALRVVDNSDTDKNGSHIVSFDPNHPRRARILEILDQHPQSKKRKALLKKLSSSFSRVYERYRRGIQRGNGGIGSFMVVGKREEQYCEEAAIQCIAKGVTPSQLIEYWDAHIKDFANGDMRIPPLSFLKNAFAVDQAACSLHEPKSRVRATGTKLRQMDRNRFSDGLDRRLRPALEEAGFATQEYPDRYLITIQHVAMALAEGRKVLLPDSKVSPLIRWAAQNLYAVPA
jgi:hypothetical protein